jgi:hypothetical protein
MKVFVLAYLHMDFYIYHDKLLIMSRIIGEKEYVHALLFLTSYITDYSSDTVAILSCDITPTSLVSLVCIQGNYFP